MKNRKISYLLLSLGISSGTILTDRFILSLPDWLALLLIVVSAVSLFVFIFGAPKIKNEVLVVLGSPNSPSGELSDIAKSRLKGCLDRYSKGKQVLCTGGWGDHFNTAPDSHASYAKAYLLNHGVDERDFLDPALSANTVEDAIKAKSILKDRNDSRLTIITSDYHLERARLIFGEILEEYRMDFVGVESLLEEVELDGLVSHEKKAVKSILKNGLYY